MNSQFNWKLTGLAWMLIFWPLYGMTQKDQDTRCVSIDFETIPKDSVYEGLVLGTQYLASLGMVFTLENGTLPVIAKVGSPMTAFGGPPSNAGPDTPAPNQNIGDYFLTDNGVVSGTNAPPLIVSFSSEVDSASGVILDIDAGEIFTIQARDITDSILEEIVIAAGDTNTGDGLATPWGFKRVEPDIFSIRFEGSRPSGAFGLGFDNFTTCAVGRSTNITETHLPIVFLSPNPAPGAFTLRSPKATIQSLTLYDLTGRRIPAEVIHDRHEAQVRSSYRGLAIVKVQTDQGMWVQKVRME
jgi:hypothetical protein